MLVNVFTVMMLSYLRKIILSSRYNSCFFLSWKVAGNIPSVDLRLSDTRLFQIIDHIQSIPFPESKTPTIVEAPIESEVCLIEFLLSKSRFY